MKKNFSFLILMVYSIISFGQCIDEVGFYPRNGTFGLASKNQYMILSSGLIIDNSNPSTPTLVGQLSINGGSTVISEGNYAYFGTGMTNDLHIVDISIITFPIEKSFFDFGIGNGVFGMAIQNETLFAALGGDGILCSIDVSNKENPQMLDTLYFSGGQCRDVALEGNKAFAATESGLKIIDITGPANMDVITSIGSGYNSVALGDNYAFMGKSAGGVDVYNISDIFNPVPAFAIVNQFGTSWDLAYNDNLLFLATDFGGLFIYKIEENTAEEMATFQHSGNGQSFGVCLQDSLVLLSGLVEGISLLMYDSSGYVGINSEIDNKRLLIYPNPATTLIDVSGSETDFISEIEIYSIEGKLFYKEAVCENKIKIDISKLKQGKYILKAISQNKTMTKPFIKM